MALSPSEAAGYLACPRQYYYSKFLGLEPSSPKQERGTRIHAMVETLLRGEIVTPQSTDEFLHEFACARALADATPEGDRAIEMQIDLSSVGVARKGRIDCLIRDRSIIVDHKTTSNWEYVPTREQLASDPQARLYAAWYQRPCTVRWQYVNVTLKTPKVGIVEWTFQQPPNVDDILIASRAHDLLSPDALPQSALQRDGIRALETTCQAYGGCKFAKACQQNKVPGTLLVRAQVEENGKMAWKKVEQDVVVPEQKKGIYEKACEILGRTDPINPAPESAPVTATKFVLDGHDGQAIEVPVEKTVVLKAEEPQTLAVEPAATKRSRGRPKKDPLSDLAGPDGPSAYIDACKADLKELHNADHEPPPQLPQNVSGAPLRGVLLVGCASLDVPCVQADSLFKSLFANFPGSDARACDYGKGVAALYAGFVLEFQKHTERYLIHVDKYAYYKNELVAAARNAGYVVIQGVG